jgi:hypothetical protein
LDLTNELVALALDDLPAIVGQSATSPFFPTNCFQFPFIWSLFMG